MLKERLYLLREQKALTRKEVADFLKIDQSTYGKYELGKREPDYETLLKLSDFYEVSVDYLLGHSEQTSVSIGEKSPTYSIDISDLTPEAIQQIETYVEFVKRKYKK